MSTMIEDAKDEAESGGLISQEEKLNWAITKTRNVCLGRKSGFCSANKRALESFCFAFIFVPYSHCDETKTLTYFMQPVCLLNADGGQWLRTGIQCWNYVIGELLFDGAVAR
jgi:hypothetical protein